MPPVEVRSLQSALESARGAQDVNGSGRRMRSPSLRVLEALGLAADEPAQWMNKERKEAEMRRLKEYKEQRKAAAEAGLGTGVVLEALTVAVDDGGNEGGGGGGGGAGSGDGGSAGSREAWRKLTPVEIRRQADHARAQLEKMKVHDEAPGATPMPAIPAEQGDAGAKRAAAIAKGGLGVGAGVLAAKATLGRPASSSRRRKEPSGAGSLDGEHAAATGKGASTKRTSGRARKRRRIDGEGVPGEEDDEEGEEYGKGGEEEGGGKAGRRNGLEDDEDYEDRRRGQGKLSGKAKRGKKKTPRQPARRRQGRGRRAAVEAEPQEPEEPVTCEFAQCLRRATFGVNGAVRYW